MIDPENTDSHHELRDVSLKRKASGGKSMGFMESRKYSTNNRDDKLNMLNAEKLLAVAKREKHTDHRRRRGR